MAYDRELANRIRELVLDQSGVTEQAMFGGLAFLINRNMAVAAASHGGLLLRVDPTENESLTAEPHVGRFTMRGREMDGWLRVDAEAVDTEEDLAHWVEIGVGFTRSLPQK